MKNVKKTETYFDWSTLFLCQSRSILSKVYKRRRAFSLLYRFPLLYRAMKVLRFLCGLFGEKKEKEDRRKMAKRQGFGVPPAMSEEAKLLKKYFNYPHYIRKHVYNAEPNSRGGCSIFTLTLDEINDVIRQTVEDRKFDYQQRSRVVFEKMFEYQIGIGLNGEGVNCCRVVCNCYSFELPDKIDLIVMEKLNLLDIVTAYPITNLSM